LQSPFEQFGGKGYRIVPPSPKKESSKLYKMELKMNEGSNHLEGIFFDEKDGIHLIAKKIEGEK
jgi:hypothetical protein